MKIKLLKPCVHDEKEYPAGAIIDVPASTADWFCEPAHKIAELVKEPAATPSVAAN